MFVAPLQGCPSYLVKSLDFRRDCGSNGAGAGSYPSPSSASTDSHPCPSPFTNSDGPDSFYSRPTSHDHSRLVEPRDSQYRKQSAGYGDTGHALRRDVDPSGYSQLLLSTGTNGPQQDSTITGTRPGFEQCQGPSEPCSAPPKRKSRREKPHIELAPDQPPTTQGKPRARVYVACIQCRSRKIRCDGAKPVCHNCSKRTKGNNECNYDAVPNRRGPDKTPGARQRIPKDMKEADEVGPVRRRRRRRDVDSRSTTTPEDHPPSGLQEPHPNTNNSNISAISSAMPVPSPASDILSTPLDFDPIYNANGPPAVFVGTNQNSLLDDTIVVDLFGKAPTAYDQSFPLSAILPLSPLDHDGDSSHAYITPLDEDNSEEDYSGVSCQPSATFTRQIWWESLLSFYISSDPDRRQNLTVAERASAAKGITSDIRFLFNTSNYWFSFFHLPTFNSNYFDPVRRERMQPSLILALLAMSTFWQSSEDGLGQLGRERSLRFRDEAQSALDASFNAGWIDETLAQSAWLLALFEVCAHPLHSSERSNSSMIMLDSIIRSLSLTLVDVDNPKTTKFSPGDVPAVLNSSRNEWLFSEEDFNPHMPSNVKPTRESLSETGCSCRSLTLIEHQQESSEQTPLWTLTPAWNDRWNEAEIRKESCRRLCWSSMILAAGHVSYTTAHRSGILKLFISDPANYALLFSGESVAYSPALSSVHSSKDTIWALHDRSFLLWHGCSRMRNDGRVSDQMKAHFAIKAWLEADIIEAALNKHTCRIERQFIFQAREYIFNTRMCISYEFQRYIPLVSANVNGLFHRRKAEEWLTHQAIVAERFMCGLHTITGNSKNLLARRPFYVFWFMGQISRALGLWECDNTLTVAMDVCKAFLPALDYLTNLWPCPEQRYRYENLRSRLANTCYLAGVSPPPPPNLRVPLSSPVVSI